jgi:hypothetical protein
LTSVSLLVVTFTYYRLVVLSSFIVIIAIYATLAVVERMEFARDTGWFAWFGGGPSGIGIGIWSIHYLGLQTFSVTMPTLNCSSVIYSTLAMIFASGPTLLVMDEESDSGRCAKEENQRSGLRRWRHRNPTITGDLISNSTAEFGGGNKEAARQLRSPSPT